VGADAAAFGGIVVNEAWSQLEPRPGREDLAPLARSLRAVTRYNAAHPGHPLTVKLRIWAGGAAPAWAKALGGGPVSIDTPTAQLTTGRWWTRGYRRAWSSFQRALADAYDDDPLIGAVAVTSCATLTAEPFVASPYRPLLQELVADGWSTAAQQRCLDGAFHDYAGWVMTPIDYTFSSMLSVTPAGAIAGPDLSFVEATMRRCAALRRTTGRQCILSNHAFTSSVASSRSAPVYVEMARLYRADPAGTEIDLQTNSPGNFGGCGAIDLAVADHASSLEVWPPAPAGGYPGFSAYPAAQLANWGRALRTQRPLHCP
jgi:hypothetical protein